MSQLGNSGLYLKVTEIYLLMLQVRLLKEQFLCNTVYYFNNQLITNTVAYIQNLSHNISAVIGSTGDGFIGIDDVVVFLTPCPTQPPMTTIPHLTHPDQQPTKADCDFENGLVKQVFAHNQYFTNMFCQIQFLLLCTRSNSGSAMGENNWTDRLSVYRAWY